MKGRRAVRKVKKNKGKNERMEEKKKEGNGGME